VATHDYVIANGTGAAVRSDLNGALAAIVSQNSNASAPATTYAYMSWADTSAGVMKMRNGANSAWISLYELDGTFLASDISLAAGSAAAPSLFFTGDTNTGIYSPGADQIGIATGGTSRIVVDASGNVNIDSGVLYVDAANNRVGIGTTTPLATLESGGGVNKASIRIADGAHDGSSSTFRYPALTYYARQDNTRRAIDPLTQGTGSNGGASAAIVFTDEPGNYSFPNNVRSSSIEFYTADNNLGGSVAYEPLNRLSISSTGTSTFTSNASTAPAIFKIDASEVSRIDSSGRLLVGTSSTIEGSAAVFQGYTGVSTNPGVVRICKGVATPANGDVLGYLTFGDSTHKTCGAIQGERDGGTWSASSVPTRLVFSTTPDGLASPTERMRIASNGNVLMGTTSTTGLATGSSANQGVYFAAGVSFFQTNNNANHYWSKATGYTSGDFTAHWVNNNYVGGITTNGSTTSYVTSSDYRLKENVIPVYDGIARFKQLKPSRFNFISHPESTVDGFLAHEAQAVVPECVTGEKDATNEDGTIKPQGIDQSKLVPLLTAALQEAIAKIETLEARLTAAGIA
jgi:hypothetical protein